MSTHEPESSSSVQTGGKPVALSETPPRRRRKAWLNLEMLFSLSAVVVAALALKQSWSAQRDLSGTEMIRAQYAIYYDFGKLEVENWQVAHMFALPDWYVDVAKTVKAAAGEMNDVKRAELELKERAIARITFTHFEEALYQWLHAVESRDAGRASFLKAVLDYYTDRVLRNPRLMFLWSESGGKMATDFELRTREYYEEHVLKQSTASAAPFDVVGPFGAPSPPAR